MSEDDMQDKMFRLKARYESLCRELNMDKETEENSWAKYLEVSERFSVYEDPLHWFCCSLFAACRDSLTPTVGATKSVVMGNCVSLTTLLRSCNISIYEFLSKIKTWYEMANLSKNFLDQVKRLEQTFSISFHLFKRFNEIFNQLFLTPCEEKRIKKCRSTKCTSSKLYDLCWCLYLCAKNENPNYTVDLVTSFHLLICCFDLIYKNVLAEKRVDLINLNFEGVPQMWNSPEFDPTSVCIINALCRMTKALPIEAKNMKENSWKEIIKEFFKTKTICGDNQTQLGIVSSENFDRNLKSFNSSYEQYVLSVGDFDERILLNNPNYRKTNMKDCADSGLHEDVKSFVPDTPLTRKNNLPSKDVKEPVASATNNVMKLQDIASLTEPTDFIRKAGNLEKLTKNILTMEQKFYDNFPTKEEAKNRFELSKSLYFYLLDVILRIEVSSKPNVDIKQLIESDILNTTLLACCIEIVLDAYNSKVEFPWILKCFGIYAFHFCKIIEIVVSRNDGILTRALIKHLNCIEETCLESLAWQKSSPLWEIVKNFGSPLPTWTEVDIENSLSRNKNILSSPPHATYDTLNSQYSDVARRDLFNVSKDNGAFESLKSQVDGYKRVGSLKIFLRKFYKLAWLRMKELCAELNMDSEIFMNKIWTLFEYSITQRTELMQNRHLDQILMCSIYLYIKVGEISGKSFTDIMRFYRKQPQATSSTYREVLIGPGNMEKDLEANKYGDIIYFYNNIYVQKMTPYALNFSEKKKSQQDLSLSPHPMERQTFPKKMSNNLFISPLEKNEVLHSPNRVTYEFSKSPAKALENINQIVRRGKRNLPFNDEDGVIDRKISKEPYYLSTIKEIMKDRIEFN